MNYTDINIEVMLVAFLAIYTLVKRASRTAMMLYVVAFNLYFAYRLNGSVMWLLPATACFNYALTQEMALREGRTRKLLLATVVVADLAVPPTSSTPRSYSTMSSDSCCAPTSR